MKALSLLSLVVVAAFSAAAQAQTQSQSFDAGIPAGWSLVNNSSAPVGGSWDRGNPGVFPAFDGAADAYAAASFLSTNALSGPVSNWMILPVLTLDATSTISFRVRAGGANFLDTLEVRFSPGSGADVGSTPTSVGSFTALLGSYASASDNGWVGQTYALGLGAPTAGRIAFRYVVADVATAGNYLGVDAISVTAVPEPATYALFGLGLAGVLLRRRLTA